MELQSPYDLYLDYEGYKIEERSYRANPAPLMGTKFTTGRSAYSDLDFWQIGAMTDFTKGINQKYMVEPSSYFYSEGIYPGKPGEITLERDTVAFEGLPEGAGTVTAEYRRLNHLYIGDDLGNIMKSANGTTFTIVHTITDTDKKIYGFYEIDGRFFATVGPGNIYSNEDPDSADTWIKIAMSTRFPLPDYDVSSSFSDSLWDTKKVAQSFKVPMGGETFHTLKVKINKVGTPPNDLIFNIYEESTDTVNEPGDLVTGATFTIDKDDVGTSWAWEEDTITAFDLEAGRKYFLVASTTAGTSGNYYRWMDARNSKATYEYGNTLTYDGADWTDCPYRDSYFELRRDTIKNLYYVMVESDYAFGWFNDGVRRSIDGYNWIPEPPDPLWVMPSGEGIPLNAVAIPKSFISGSQRGLWSFVGGSSGLNIWDFPDYTNANNFRGLEKWGHYAIFSVEDQGIYYTDGSQVVPTTLNYLSEGFTFKSCKHIHSNGWDVYALVSDNGTDWYLARTNMSYNSQPKYWWIVKKLKSEPAKIVGWDDEKIFIFYEDKTAESFDKIDGPYVTSGYLTTSWIDENLIKILKMYNSLSLIFSEFPGNSATASSTYAKLSYLVDRQDNYINSDITYGDTGVSEMVYSFPNPTLGSRMQIKLTLGGSPASTAVAPVVTDLTWKYILQKPVEDVTTKKNFTFTVLAEDSLENNLGDSEVLGETTAKDNENIKDNLWETSAKKQVLNYIGPDNKSQIGLEITCSDTDRDSLLTIDRTNYTISYSTESTLDEFTSNANIGGGSHSYSYKDKTLTQVASGLEDLIDTLTVTVHQDQDGNRSANDLEPIKDRAIGKDNNTYLMVGTDVYAVIMGSNSPSQSKLALDGRGSDRLQISLREA